MSLATTFLTSIRSRFMQYKQLGDAVFTQLTEAEMHHQPHSNSNSVAHIIQHMSGNMISRFTGFLETDGEKPNRNRDAEFEDQQLSKAALLATWQKGWNCVFDAIDQLQEADLERTVTIRSEPHVVVDALHRQLAHYSYHTGQLVYLGRLICKERWQQLSIPKGQSLQFNQAMNQKHA